MTDKPAQTDTAGIAPRRAAHDLLQRVTGEGRLLSELIGGGALERLDPADRARAQRLALMGLRGLDRADRLLKPHLKKNPPAFVRNALRLGVAEIGAGEAPHGVVNAYVELTARNKRTGQMKGLVNAVLRKITAQDWDKAPVPVMPGWLRQPLVAAWGLSLIHISEPTRPY